MIRPKVLIPLALLAIGWSALLAAQNPAPLDSTIAALTPMLGGWFPANVAGAARRPPPDYVVHRYEATVGGKAIRLREGFRGDPSQAEFDGLIYWDPRRERIVFVGVAGRGPGQGRTFTGEYRRLADGSIERTYDVVYRTAADTPAEELGGRWRRYRETFRMATADSVESRLEWWRDGRWQPFGPGTYTVVRR
ncbi:MAG: hypothetical protein ACKVZ0_10700 [Gemmatimonadales bacterium]